MEPRHRRFRHPRDRNPNRSPLHRHRSGGGRRGTHLRDRRRHPHRRHTLRHDLATLQPARHVAPPERSLGRHANFHFRPPGRLHPASRTQDTKTDVTINPCFGREGAVRSAGVCPLSFFILRPKALTKSIIPCPKTIIKSVFSCFSQGYF